MRMKDKFKILGVMLITIFTLSALIGVNIKKASAVTKGPELLITEVMPMAESGDDHLEYIEIYNNTNENIDLKNYKFIYPEADINVSKILPPRGIVVVCTNASTSLDSFNVFYGKQLTSDKYLQLGSREEVLSNAGDQYVVLAKDDFTIICVAGYKAEDFDIKKSVGYKYPETGVEMIKFGQKQAPTPGEANIDQVPYTQIPVSAVKLNSLNAEINVGSTIQLIATIIPANAANKNITWSSSNSSVAQVFSNGLVYGKTQGTAVITVKTADRGYSASCSVAVKPAETTVYVQDIKLDKTYAALELGKILKLNVQIIPSNAADKRIVWASNNTDVALVNAQGEVTPKSAGTAIISASTPDDAHKAVCFVTVIQPQKISVTGVKLNKNCMTLKPGQSETLIASVLPQNASNKNLTWVSENTGIAYVDQTGKVTAVKEGVTIVTVKTQEGGFISVCPVIVKGTAESIGKVTGVRLNHSILIIKDNKIQKLVAIIEPGNASNKKVKWNSSNKDVAEVLQDGRIIPKSGGVAEVIVTTDDGGYKAKCIVVVMEDKSKGNGNGHGKGHNK